MKTKKTIYHLVIDKSGSMSDCIDNTINGFNEQVNKIREMEKEFPGQDISIGLTTFNDEISHYYFNASPDRVHPLTARTYRPCGGTAMYDAIGSTVTHLERESGMTGENQGNTFVIVIITDGYENASRQYDLSQIKSLISRLEETGNWTFSFIGATLDAAEVAEQMSINRKNSFCFDKKDMKNKVWDNLSDSMNQYLQKKREGRDLNRLFEK